MAFLNCLFHFSTMDSLSNSYVHRKERPDFIYVAVRN